MPAFVFRFEPVLRQRQAAEDHVHRDLAKVLRHRARMEAQLRSMHHDISQSKQNLGVALVGSIDLKEVSQFASYSGQVNHRAAALVASMAGLEKRIKEVRQHLVKVTRARRALELLRERHHKQWRRGQVLREVALQDEIAIQRVIRGSELEVCT